MREAGPGRAGSGHLGRLELREQRALLESTPEKPHAAVFFFAAGEAEGLRARFNDSCWEKFKRGRWQSSEKVAVVAV